MTKIKIAASLPIDEKLQEISDYLEMLQAELQKVLDEVENRNYDEEEIDEADLETAINELEDAVSNIDDACYEIDTAMFYLT